MGWMRETEIGMEVWFLAWSFWRKDGSGSGDALSIIRLRTSFIEKFLDQAWG